ncbi:MAG: hypothetical protein ACYC2I_02320 [Elusimicrobiales bacterium]
MFWKLKKLLSPLFREERGPETVAVTATLYAPDGKHRVRFFRRDEDGACGWLEEYYDDKLLEMTWRPAGKGTSKEYPDRAAAEADARAQVPWLHLVLP